ncbi:metal ABC transporter permease [Fusibacter sp. 3D3]|uniref:metal ABC transporter permease n=1 Tax=Fusibacter sp. 3D3 TaxID=1048380 RepID=UPI0008537A72|nr:metal ABC transporter permease [Fusibacter sp. 3D3]GAU75905.1 manganese ABC transporter inner membrane permease protein SitD [Fusibacter sp. 3D3]
MSAQIEIQLIAIIVAVACSIPGVFLVLRKMAMMTDAITHTILLGIILAFFIVKDLSSPLLILGAALVGLLTVYLVEVLHKTKLVSEDSAIGIVFPMLFSIAIIIISKYAGDIHLDTDSVLLGELAFAPFNRLKIMGVDIGAKALYTMTMVLILNLGLVIIFFKELKISIFDSGLAAVLGFSPVLIQYGLMASVSVTTVAAFEAVGSILVIAFMIGPPVTAYLLTDDLKKMLVTSAFLGGLNAVLGYRIAYLFDVSIAGSMAMMTGITFLLVFIFAPSRGMITVARRRYTQHLEFTKKSILFHMLQHEGEANEKQENGVETIFNHINQSKEFVNKMMKELVEESMISVNQDVYCLTEKGKTYTIESYEEIVQSFNTEYTT